MTRFFLLLVCSSVLALGACSSSASLTGPDPAGSRAILHDGTDSGSNTVRAVLSSGTDSGSNNVRVVLRSGTDSGSNNLK